MLANPYVLFVKGGVDSLLGVTSQVWVDGVIQPLDEHWSARVEAANNRLAQQGLRVLGVAVFANWLNMNVHCRVNRGIR